MVQVGDIHSPALLPGLGCSPLLHRVRSHSMKQVSVVLTRDKRAVKSHCHSDRGHRIQPQSVIAGTV